MWGGHMMCSSWPLHIFPRSTSDKLHNTVRIWTEIHVKISAVNVFAHPWDLVFVDFSVEWPTAPVALDRLVAVTSEATVASPPLEAKWWQQLLRQYFPNFLRMRKFPLLVFGGGATNIIISPTFHCTSTVALCMTLKIIEHRHWRSDSKTEDAWTRGSRLPPLSFPPSDP